MSSLSTYFSNFLTRIRLQPNDVTELQKAHKTLTERLKSDETLNEIILGTFLQGSYRRSTIVKPANGKKSDVDLVVVTRIKDNVEPKAVINHFVPFVKKHYQDNFEPQNRSIGIVDGNVELDLVITSAPSEAVEGLIKSMGYDYAYPIEVFRNHQLAEGHADHAYEDFPEEVGAWKEDPLSIPDQTVKAWRPTHPIEQIKKTTEKNKKCQGYYLGVVQALKWWHRNNKSLPKYPKGYPLEHIIWHCCPDDIQSVAEGVVATLKGVQDKFATNIVMNKKPQLKDHGVDHDVLKQLSIEDFTAFYKECGNAHKVAEKAFVSTSVEESISYWKILFGDEFDPSGTGSGPGTGGFKKPSASSEPPGGRFG